MINNNIKVSGGFRTESENLESSKIKEVFENNQSSLELKLENFPKYIKRQNLTRLLALYEIFKLTLEVKGSIIECGKSRFWLNVMGKVFINS